MLSGIFKSLVPHAIKRKLRKFVWMRLNPSWTLKSGIIVRVLNYNDWMIYNDIFVEGEYDDAINDLLHGVTADENRVARTLDLGGNVGFFTLRLADQFLRAGHGNFDVVIVEGSPSTYAELRERLAANQHLLANRVTAIHGLAGDRAGVGEIGEGESHGENTIFDRGPGRKKVPFIDLADLVKSWERIDLLKCDIEGAEELFLRNYPELLRKTDRAVFEFHHDKCDIPLCRELLGDAGLERALTVREFGHCSVEFFRRLAVRQNA
jgi:FkbM family methyltransferase